MDDSSNQQPHGALPTITSSEFTTVSSSSTVEELETKFETIPETLETDNDEQQSTTNKMYKQASENNLLSSSSSTLLEMIQDSNINQEELLEINRRNTINILPTHFVHKRGSQELPELVSPYRKIATTNNLKTALKNSSSSSSSSHPLNKSGNSASYSKIEKGRGGDPYKSLQILTNDRNNQSFNGNSSESFAKYKYALENDDFSQIDFGLEVNSAQTSASEITFPVPNKPNAFYGNAQNSGGNGNYFFNGQPNTASVDETMMRKNSVIDDSVSDSGELEISKHYELYLICIGDLDNCLVHKMLKTAGGQMYISNRQVSFILRNNNEKVTCTFNFYSQFNWYLMDFLKDEAKDCHGLLFMFNITHSEGWSELKQTISKKYVDVQDFVKPSIVLGTYSHSNRMPSVVNTSQVISVVDKWKEKQIISYLEIDVEDKDECKMALTHLATTIIQNMKDKEKETRPRRGNPIFSKICGSVSGD